MALLWARHLQPRILRLIEKIPQRRGYQLAGVLGAVMVTLTLLSAAAVWRWTLRLDGLSPDGALEVVLDRYFPNDVMDTIYSNMSFTKS